jgi:hypothetical protein
MRHAGRLDAAQLGRKTGYGFVEAQMRPTTTQEIQNVISEHAIAVHDYVLFNRRFLSAN